WVSASHSIGAEVRLYNNLFEKENPGDEKDGNDFRTSLNPNSLETLTTCRVEPSLADAAPESRYQFERIGYFCVDSVDSSHESLVFNRTVTLRDTWAKIKATTPMPTASGTLRNTGAKIKKAQKK
ncbi:MAG: hypothetical protein JRI88_05805, partial [Deltaproteobacteria bacterium]|nr:hypothetical protein [Deltaproteobacteria bacterium]